MGEKEIKSYLDLINIKTINGYYKYVALICVTLILTAIIGLDIPREIMANYSEIINFGLFSLNYGGTSIMLLNKYRKNKKEYIKNNDINFSTSVKECYEVLKKEEIVSKYTPIENVIARHYINTDSYLTSKGKRLVKRR